MTSQYRWLGAELELYGDGLSLCWGRFVVQAHCDWLPLLRPSAWNWIDFRFAGLGVEWGRQMGDFDIDAALLGFRLRFSWNYADTPARAEIRRRVDAMLGEGE